MDLVDDSDKHYYIIKVFKFIEEENDIVFKNICNYLNNHENIISSLVYIRKSKKAKNINEDKEDIIITASIDKTLKIIKINEFSN